MEPDPGRALAPHSRLCHRCDVLSDQVARELAESEAPNGRVPCGEGGRIVFHPAVAELTALFGMAEQGLDPRAAVRKPPAGGALALRQRAEIEAGLLEANLRQPGQRAQRLPVGSAVIALIRPTRPQGAFAKEPLVFGDQGTQGGGVWADENWRY